MKLRRFMLGFVSTGILASAALVQAEGWTPRPFASQVQDQQSANEPAPVQKDDSQLRVVERPTFAPPIVDVAGKTKRKSAPSAWSKIWRPSQWFSSSKSKK